MNPNQKQENLETPSPTQRKGGLMKKNTFDNNILLKNTLNKLNIECSMQPGKNVNFANAAAGGGGNSSDRRKSISFSEFSNLIHIFEDNENEKIAKEILEQLGLNSKSESIPITNLVDIIKQNRSSKAYRDLYDKISDLFVPICERVISILKDARKKFSELNLELHHNDIDWVINKINSGDIYNCDLNYDFLNAIKSNDDYADFENSMKLIQEYSSDQFTKSKKEDVLEVKRLSNIRKQMKESEQQPPQKLQSFQGNKSVKNMSCSNIMEKNGVSSYAQLANDLKILNKRRSTVLNADGNEPAFAGRKDKGQCAAGNEKVIEEEAREGKINALEAHAADIAAVNYTRRRKHCGSNFFYWSNQRSVFKISEHKSRKESRSSLNIAMVEKEQFKNLLILKNNNNYFNKLNDNANNAKSTCHNTDVVNDSEKNKIREFEAYKNTEVNLGNSSGDKLSKLNRDLIAREAQKNSLSRRSFENQLDLFIRESYSDNDTHLNAEEHELNTTSQFNLGECSNRSSLKKLKMPAFLVNEVNSNISDNEKSFSKSKSSNSDANDYANHNDNNNNNKEDSLDIINRLKRNQSGNKYQRFSISRFSIFKTNQSFSNVNNNNLNNDANNNSNINNNNNNNNNNLNFNIDYNFPALKLDSPNNSLNIQIQKHFKNFERYDFNVFDYAEACGRENVLINISDYLFEKNSLYVFISKKRFETFIDKIRLGYDYLLPYHNDLHAVDVLQTCGIFMQYLDLINSLQLTFLDVCGFLIAAIIHDFKHPGLNNSFQINKKTKLANRYNDVSVLENYHVSAAFKIISKPNANIFKDLHVEEYRVVRKRIVECVLATDMAKHTKAQTSLRIKLESLKRMEGDFGFSAAAENSNKDNNNKDIICSSNKEKNFELDFNQENKETKKNLLLENLVNNLDIDNKFDRQQEILNFLIHSADISNPTKPFAICKAWTELVMEEFFMQGDLEKKKSLPVSFLCDRNTTNIPKSQIGFISNIVMPNFKILAMLSDNCGIFVDNLLNNIENWKKEDEKVQVKAAAVGKSPVAVK